MFAIKTKLSGTSIDKSKVTEVKGRVLSPDELEQVSGGMSFHHMPRLGAPRLSGAPEPFFKQ